MVRKNKRKRKQRRKINPNKAGVITKQEMIRTRMRGSITGELKSNAPVEAIKGIGKKKANKLRKKGISTVAEYKRAYD